MTLAKEILKDLRKLEKETYYVIQGDVALKRTFEEIPSDFVRINGDIIKKGDNDHKITGDYSILSNKEKMIVVVGNKEASLYHPQHTPAIKLSEGVYDVIFTKEYDHMTEESREVID